MSRSLYDTTLCDLKSVNSDLFRSPITGHRSRRQAFTLVELLVVIGIIAILAAVLFPVFAQAKEAAKKTTCLSNEKQFATACLLYTSDYDDQFPSHNFEDLAPNVYKDNNWFNSTIIDYNTTPTTFTYKGGLLDQYLKAFELTGCPSGRDLLNWDIWNFSDKTKGVMSYGYNAGSGGSFTGLDNKNVSDVQESANTFLLGDCAQYLTVAYGVANGGGSLFVPKDDIYAEWQGVNGTIHGRHPGSKSNIAWVDGHVKTMPITFRDCELSPANVSWGRTRAKYNSYKVGWLCQAGLVAQTGSLGNGATTIQNDTRFYNYFRYKKVP